MSINDSRSTREQLKTAIIRYADQHADANGVAQTPVPGFRMMRAPAPLGPLRSIYRPLICLVLQGSKLMLAGREERLLEPGQSIIVGAHLPVTGHVVEATVTSPYVALSIEIHLAMLHGLALEIGELPIAPRVPVPIFSENLDDTIMSCALRLMQLLDYPEAIAPLRPAIMRELHYWLLRSPHGPALRQLSLPTGEAQRLSRAIDLLRDHYREPLSVARLAAAANLSASAFRRQFKQLTSLSPIQFQKQLRLAEARRLMTSQVMASRAAILVGYQSPSHFSRDFARVFGAPPRRDRIARIEHEHQSDPVASH